ncbi:MAG: transposase [Bacteroidetes bacterium]|nr:transposase [Bacteroidota bacterium]
MGRRGRNNLIEEHFFFVTTTVVEFTPIFNAPLFCDILILNLKHYQKKYKFKILGYVIMPTHFHWIVQVNPKYGSISDVMRDIKKFTAWQIFDVLDKSKDKSLSDIFEKAASGINDQRKKLWMKRFDDEVIRDQKMFLTKLKYIHNNPVKAGLEYREEDYKYSSARNYINNNHSIIEVDTQLSGVNVY